MQKKAEVKCCSFNPVINKGRVKDWIPPPQSNGGMMWNLTSNVSKTTSKKK